LLLARPVRDAGGGLCARVDPAVDKDDLHSASVPADGHIARFHGQEREVVMIRFVALAALAFAVAFGGSIGAGTMSGADAKSYRSKMCRHVTLTGKVKRWRCKRGQFCCSAEIWGYYGCGSKSLGCFNPG
jgi:hypothetical protein